MRIRAARAVFEEYMGCTNCLAPSIIANDLRPLAALMLLWALAMLGAWRLWRAVLVAGALVLITAYALDIGIFLLFGYRLQIASFFRYAGETRAAWMVAAPLLAEPRGWVFVAALFAAWLGWTALIWRAQVGWQRAVSLTLLSIALVAVAHWKGNPGYVRTEAYLDVLTNNRPSGVSTPYSQGLRSKLVMQPELPATCVPAKVEQPRNVILVVLESLSARHSQLLGGSSDSTPQLDRLAQAHSYFPEFHANGFTTDGGLIALLTGFIPLPTTGRYDTLDVYAGYEKPVIPTAFAQLSQTGYETQFFTTGDLRFLDKGRWLHGLGLTHVEGSEQPYYASLPRGAFDDTGDRSLYDRYLDWFDREKTAHLNFSTLLTVSTHPPFRVPGTDIADEAAAFRYADAQVGRFVDELAQRGYFENGVLLVTGDHRAMTTIPIAERRVFGEGALSRLPAVVIGPAGIPQGAIPGRWQQTDFLAGLLDLAGVPTCTVAWRGRLLGPNHQSADYVLHVQGIDRERVIAWPRAGSVNALRLDGDGTDWAGPRPPEPLASQILDALNRQRALLPEPPRNLIDLIIRSRLPQAPAQ